MMFFTGEQTAVDPQNNVWVIRRVWIPRWASPNVKKRFLWWRGRIGKFGGEGAEGLEAIGEYFIVALAVLLFLAIAIFFLIPLLLVIFDLVVLLFFVLIAISGRVIFRRPWIIRVIRSDGHIFERNVIGWSDSKTEIDVLKQDILNGNFGSMGNGEI